MVKSLRQLRREAKRLKAPVTSIGEVCELLGINQSFVSHNRNNPKHCVTYLVKEVFNLIILSGEIPTFKEGFKELELWEKAIIVNQNRIKLFQNTVNK